MSRRPLAALASVILAVSSLVILLPECAYACQCSMLPGSQKERAERALSDSKAVFSGEVVDFEKSPFPTTMMEGTMVTTMIFPRSATVTLRVSEVWKGPRQQTVQLTTDVADGISCGYPFEEGQEYLVYAYGWRQGLVADGCTETKRLSEAGTDLEVLGAGKKPTGGGALSDTSGDVSVRAMFGLAGLVLAASLSMVMRLVRTG
jgi:hypothetical protein